MSQWLKVLLEAKKISKTKYLEVIDYIDKNKVK
jgi:hypothetical protein